MPQFKVRLSKLVAGKPQEFVVIATDVDDARKSAEQIGLPVLSVTLIEKSEAPTDFNAPVSQRE